MSSSHLYPYMSITTNVQESLTRHQSHIDTALRAYVQQFSPPGSPFHSYYGQMQYHLGWVDTAFQPIANNPGKILRPTLVLLAYEVVAAAQDLEGSPDHYLARALPVAIAVELVHNFSLIHDDIEDGDEARRHRPTLWKAWGVPQAINTGDGMFAIARLALAQLTRVGVSPQTTIQLYQLFDRACATLAEGQFLDMDFEQHLDITTSMYFDMISRKTGALIKSSAELGAILGTQDQQTIERFRTFGAALGAAFQVRDDLLGVWATTAESGKTPAGDIYRRKQSLPILHALEHASPPDQARLHSLYQQSSPFSSLEVAEILSIFEQTNTLSYCRNYLAHQCQSAHNSLSSFPIPTHPVSQRALQDLRSLILFLETSTQP